MKPTPSQEKEIFKVYDTWLHSYLNGDIETYDSFLDDSYHFIGSTNNEEFLNRKDATDFFRKTAHQFSGKTDLRNEKRIVEKFGELVILTHVFDAWFLNHKDWTYYGRFRFTSTLQEKKEGWRFIYQHFSTTDSKTDEGETIGYDKVNAENQELREAIKRRTLELEEKNRKLEIESALERIRSQVTAMKKSSDLLDIVVSMREEFTQLGHRADYFWHMMWLPDKFEKAMTSGDGSKIGMIMELPRDFHSHYKGMDEWEANDEPSMILALEVEEAVDYIDKMITLGNFQQVDPNAPTLDDIRHIGGITFVMARTTHGEIGYSLPGVVRNPPEKDIQILERFASVFDLAHRRFLDLQNAERQAREVEIELALERVRARTMAMQKSEELGETAELLFQQVEELGIETWTTGFNIWNKDNNSFVDRVSLKYGFIEPYEVDCKAHPFFADLAKARNSGEDFHVFELEGTYLEEIYAIMAGMARLNFEKIKESGMTLPSRQFNHYVFGEEVSLMFITFEPCPESWDIFKRFGKVFEQTYTRFLDLLKAEAQTREAQIEAALERVRSKTMSMHNSKDMEGIVITLFEEVLNLGLDSSMRCGLGILEGHERMETRSVNASPDGKVELRVGMLNMTIHPMLVGLKKAWERGDDEYSYYYSKKDVRKYYEALNKEPEYPFNANLEALPEQEYHQSYFYSSGILFAFSENPITKESSGILSRFAAVFGQTYRRYLDLQKAEEQSREAQIELALERVRNRAMTMMNSDELGDLIITVFKELQGLDMELTRCLLWIFNKEDESAVAWMTNSEDPDRADHYHVPYHNHPAYKNYIKSWKLQLAEWEYDLKGKNKDNWDEILVEGFFKKLPRKVKNAMKAPKQIILSGSFNKYGLIQTAGLEPLSTENKGILKRFSQVFEQNYNRFLDLKKAEKQAREAQIEAALEKVRARTMAMQSSQELQDAANLLFLEVQGLGINAWSAGYNIVNERKTQSECWMSSEGELQDPFPLYFTKEASFQAMGKFLKSEDTFFVQELKGKALERHYNYMRSLPELKETFQHLDDAGLSLPTYQINHLCKFSKGFLLFITYEKDPDAHEIFRRFTNVFEQTYTRFQDLQKAENQSKEAQIELALERVRASTMAMHESKQLAETAQVLFEQFDLLGVIPDRISIAIYNEDKRLFELWATDQNGILVDHVHDFSIDEPTCMSKTYKAWKKGEESFVVDLQGKELEEWVQFVREDTQMEIDASQFRGRRVQHSAFFSNGYLMLSSHEPIPEEMMKLLLRFAKVFEQTYTRFLDLQKAELQAREAIKHASVDRVRAEIASMRTTKDLKRITPLIWNELNTLNVPFIRCGVFIMNEEEQMVQTYLSTPDGKAIASFDLPFDDTKPLTELLPHWRKKEMYTDFWDESAFIESTKILMNRGAISSKENYTTENRPTNLHLHFLPFLQGMLYVGSEVPLNKDELNLAHNLADAFSTAYSRYDDFKKLELANKKIEKTLVDLKQTQAQLIQSEKMASLGELTAGIAHEIQNPLNFVNNFSEVSHELLTEMIEELDNGDLEEVREITKDIEQNLEKINHHGHRASDIVKGMLQHSRSSSGEKELIDINALADEYLRLAYHGLRAKDKSFNSRMETDLEENLEKIKVVPQEIGRVILNLITNAFHTVSEKKKASAEPYDPIVRVSTKKVGKAIEIVVKDNGNGIPKKVQDKIFQPFFTTKPTGQGTGLGLSLSYDIVKAHGGELKVESSEKEGTELKIILPI
ncbi:nuclear transport factor 2 family protein [Lutimonas saemankumensis]|uniref:ATP-binding protein n=1 Tax=Lutimonas saemankumensis TaxID=483016 RepID=UPI001CD2933B|nr:ATP-binding protein [Lutimonas saemankumensis]MCA0930863.1 nuclear transport factor 2 family protein [Lutimonas saemankumensis]